MRVAVVEVRKLRLPEKLGADLVRQAAEDGARRAGAKTLDDGRDGAACRDEACWLQVAEFSGATHVLIVDAEYDRLAYALSVILWSATDREPRPAATAECTTCPAKDLLAKVTDLSARVVTTERARQIAATTTPEPEAHPGPSTGIPPGVHTNASPDAAHAGASPMLAYGLAGTGAALVTAGVILWTTDGRRSDCEADPAGGSRVCVDTLKTKAIALPLALAGLGVGLWGGYEWSRLSRASVTVTLGPGVVTLGGRF
jgi:hypothetical protein